MTTRSFVKPAVFLATLTLSSLAIADTLRDAVECALRLNPDVRFAATHRWTTEEQLKQQKAGFLPTLDLAAGEGYQDSNTPNTVLIGRGHAVSLRRSEASATLDQSLFSGFATINEVRRLKATVNAAAYKTGGVSEDIAIKATEQYLEILRRQELLKLANNNLGTHKSTDGMVGERTKAGISRSSDLDQANGRLALAHANVVAENGNLIDAKSSYMRVVGIAPNALVRPRAPKNSELPASVEQAITEALETHPTLKSANADVAAARAQHETAKSNNYPHLDLVLSASRNRNLDGLEGVNNDEKAMLRGTWNLFKGGQDLARQRETSYQVQEAMDVRNRTIWEIQESTRLSWNAWQASKERLNFLQKHRDLAKSAVGAYQDQFKLNQRTLLDLLNSQNEYYQANVDYITAEYTELYARFRLLNSMGKLVSYLGAAYPAEANLKTPAYPSSRDLPSQG